MSVPYLPSPNQILKAKMEELVPSSGGDRQPNIVAEYLRVLLRNHRTIAVCGLLGLVAALLISLSMR